ncbi:unnamed protein product [Fraxinus pennsylvanica]|uniref:Uncharacterized protein n=1 Tax=Fraxinus pennsylvanica TaxID=56036 RepID=A0AAD2DYL4_9LAMI|nr:unnamed protein product [Fraxinus pennsylvanica]
MFARRIKCKDQRWGNVVQHGKVLISSYCRDQCAALCSTHAPIARNYSSQGDGRNASEDKNTPAKDLTDCDKGKIPKENITESIRHYDALTRLGEQDEKEWLKNEKHAIENEKKESPFLTRRERFKKEFLRRVVPWEKLMVSWSTFPYHIK